MLFPASELTGSRTSDFDGIQSEDGVYQWVVSSFYGSYPQSQAFRVLQ